MVTIVPSKHNIFALCWTNVGIASQTVGQHWSDVGQMSCVCWKATFTMFFNLLTRGPSLYVRI